MLSVENLLPPEQRPILKLGSGCGLTEWIEINNWVYYAQMVLTTLGYYSGKLDGCFGKATEQAVKDFQEDAGLTVHGVVHEKTWAALDAEFQKEKGAPMVRSYGERKTNTWKPIALDEETLKSTCIEPNVIYEAIYGIPKKEWYDFLMFWRKEFDPKKFTAGLREKLAGAMDVTKEEMEIPWWLYDNQSEHATYTVQFKYAPSEQAKVAAVAFPWVPIVILSGMFLIGYLATIFHFTTSPKLESLRKLLEKGAEVIPKILKYGLYIVLAGGSFWLLGKVISKARKKEAKA